MGGKKKEENFRIFVGAPNFGVAEEHKTLGIFPILNGRFWRLDLPKTRKRGEIDRCLEEDPEDGKVVDEVMV